jgi:hypothetical protein
MTTFYPVINLPDGQVYEAIITSYGNRPVIHQTLLAPQREALQQLGNALFNHHRQLADYKIQYTKDRGIIFYCIKKDIQLNDSVKKAAEKFETLLLSSATSLPTGVQFRSNSSAPTSEGEDEEKAAEGPLHRMSRPGSLFERLAPPLMNRLPSQLNQVAPSKELLQLCDCFPQLFPQRQDLGQLLGLYAHLKKPSAQAAAAASSASRSAGSAEAPEPSSDDEAEVLQSPAAPPRGDVAAQLD